MTEVLLAASGPKTRDLFSSMLGELGYTDILCVSTGREAWRLLQEKSFSLVLIVSPLREGKGFDLAKMAAQTTAGVILICRPILYEEASTRLESTGVFVLSTDMGRRFFNEAVKLMAAVHKRLAGAEPQTERMQQKLKDIRIVDKAKCLLIQYEGMTEEDAHRRIEKQAMDRRRSQTGNCGGDSGLLQFLLMNKHPTAFFRKSEREVSKSIEYRGNERKERKQHGTNSLYCAGKRHGL